MRSSYSQQTTSIQEAFTAHYQTINTATWPCWDHFTFYRQFANPSFSLCVPVAAQCLYECAKDRQVSLFQLVLYALLRATSGIPQLRQCVRNDEVIEYGSLAVMTPVMTVEEGFRQVWCDNTPEFTTFSDAVTPKIVAARETAPAPLVVDGEHFIYTSCLPWLRFTSMTHTKYAVGTAAPALTWGKLQNDMIPVTGWFNHVFVDGLHASRFFALVEEGFSGPERL